MSHDSSSSDSASMRRTAEERLAESVAEDDDLHELRVHQIELEMQGEELVLAQEDLDAERRKYFNLYHRAPVGYLTLDERTTVCDANRTASRPFDASPTTSNSGNSLRTLLTPPITTWWSSTMSTLVLFIVSLSVKSLIEPKQASIVAVM